MTQVISTNPQVIQIAEQMYVGFGIIPKDDFIKDTISLDGKNMICITNNGLYIVLYSNTDKNISQVNFNSITKEITFVIRSYITLVVDGCKHYNSKSKHYTVYFNDITQNYAITMSYLNDLTVSGIHHHKSNTTFEMWKHDNLKNLYTVVTTKHYKGKTHTVDTRTCNNIPFPTIYCLKY
jgi:hypothetical protein